MALTVAQLIEILESADPDYRILAFDSEGDSILLEKEDVTIDDLHKCVCVALRYGS